MDPIGAYLLELLPLYGPWLLALMAALETCFITGLVVPSGMATSFATALALEEGLALGPMLVAAAAGGAVGDTAGYWIGRKWGGRILEGESRLARITRVRHARLADFFGRHPVYSVSVGRLISFARTLMPMAAGMSGLRYRTFLFYELFGLVGWVALYAGIGMLAGESWEAVARWVGVGGAALFALAGAVLWIVWRRRRGRTVPRRDP
ncbi:MAG: VTT domain-containing protein [Gemmatimonadota bacterium]